MRSIHFLGVYVCVHVRSDGGSVGVFPHKCQLVAKGISISHRRTGGVLLDAWLRFVIHIFGISVNSKLMRIHNYLMIFFKIIFMAL